MASVRKEYLSRFSLEDTKLRRIVQSIDESMKGSGAVGKRADVFRVWMKGSQTAEYKSDEELLSNPNSDRHRIERLLISSRCEDGHTIEVEFYGPSETASTSGTRALVISIRVGSPESGFWPDQTLASLEEQIERTFDKRVHWQPTVGLVAGLVMFILALLTLQPRVVATTDQRSNVMWLYQDDMDEVAPIVAKGELTPQDALKIQYLQLRNLLEWERPPDLPKDPKAHHRGLFLFIPTLIELVLAIILIKLGTPPAIYRWGDQVEREVRREKHVQSLENLVLGIGIVGVIGCVFAQGLFG